MGSEDKWVFGTKTFKIKTLIAFPTGSTVINLAHIDASTAILHPMPARLSYLYQL